MSCLTNNLIHRRFHMCSDKFQLCGYLENLNVYIIALHPQKC